MIYAIADLHGRFDLLCRALRDIEGQAPPGNHKIIILGDFIDRGPQSRMIIDLLMMNGGITNKDIELVVLQGNHEAMMLAAFTSLNAKTFKWWTGNGGAATLLSYGYEDGDKIVPLKVPEKHLAWLHSLPLFRTVGEYIFVHAGVPWDTEPVKAKREALQWMLYGDDDGSNGDYPDDFMDDQPHVSGKHIVHGHHQSASHPLLKPHRTNLDAHAYYTGRLAIGVFEPDVVGGPVNVLWAEV